MSDETTKINIKICGLKSRVPNCDYRKPLLSFADKRVDGCIYHDNCFYKKDLDIHIDTEHFKEL